MTSSEVMMLQRELHKLAEQNRQDHQLVRDALKQLQGDLDALGKRLNTVEDTDKEMAAINRDRQQRFRKNIALVGALAAVVGVMSGLIAAGINQL